MGKADFKSGAWQGVMTHSCNPRYLGSRDRRVAVQGSLSKNTKPYSKNN
jgi:hypothetical protein